MRVLNSLFLRGVLVSSLPYAAMGYSRVFKNGQGASWFFRLEGGTDYASVTIGINGTKRR